MKRFSIFEFYGDGHRGPTEGRTVIWMKDDDFVPSFFHSDERDDPPDERDDHPG